MKGSKRAELIRRRNRKLLGHSKGHSAKLEEGAKKSGKLEGWRDNKKIEKGTMFEQIYTRLFRKAHSKSTKREKGDN